jgi:chitinase
MLGAGAACGSSGSGAPETAGTPEGGARDTGGSVDASHGHTDAGHPVIDAGHGKGDTGALADTGAVVDTGGGGHDSAMSGDTGGGSTSGAWIMGYFSNWEDAANGGSYATTSVDWAGLTHVLAAFYVPDGTGGFEAGDFNSTLADPLISAAHSHGKKVIASIGGAGSGPVFEGSTSAANMTKFLTSLQALITEGFDGLDIDWEGGNLSASADQALETSLIGSLRSANPGAILTMTAGYENENLLDDLSFYGTISAKLDRINLMTYGMSGAWQGWTSWHSSPLHWNMNSSTPTGIDSSVSHYLSAGVPAAKLGVGAGFYGECYTSPVTAPVQMLGASQIAASDGTMSYTNIMSTYYSASAYHYDSAAAVPYLTLSGSNAESCTFVSYEDVTSIKAKAAWVKSKGLGGIIIWTLAEGYVSSGATVADQNPLVEAMQGVY